MRSLESGRSGRVLSCLLLAALAGAGPASAGPSPSGPQKVLVILMNLGSTLAELCPYQTPCPVNPKSDAPYYQPPRHTSGEWQTLLNNYAQPYWQLASYGQTQPQFTVLDSLASNGWWKPPHAAADYYVNGDFYADSKSFGFVEDTARGAIEAYCSYSNQICSSIAQYDRLIVMSNKKARGGVTSPGSLTVNTAYGDFLFATVSFVDESYSDADALSVILHEFGHQLGMPTHYGDCAPSYIPAIQGPLECLGPWDIMAYDYGWPMPTGYSRLSRGWIDPQTTLSHDLLSGTPFSDLTFIRPVSQAPNGIPNLIRLSIGGLDWPEFYGYFVECRKKVFGDEGLYPGSSGVPQEGLLVTSVHEFSVHNKINPTLPMHVVRKQVYPPGGLYTATLQPGESFTDAQLGLFVRLDGFAGDDAEPFCDVEVDYLTPPRTGPILLWQNRVVPDAIHGFGSFDIGLNHPAPPDDAGGGASQPLPVDPPWTRHPNALVVRAHTTGTLPAENARLSVSITQPALFTSSCGTFTDPSARDISLPPVDPAKGASAMVNFEPRRGSLGIQMFAPADPSTGRDASDVVSSRLAFQFFQAGKLSRQRTHFTIRANDGCEGETLFHVSPSFVPEGWKVTVSPEIIAIAPGLQTDVAVTVTPPAGAQPGQNAEIGIDVLQAEDAPRPGPADQPEDPVLQQHLESVGLMQVSARVVGEPATVDLTCAAAPAGGVSVSGNIAPAVPNRTVMLEYTSFGAAPKTRFVTTDAAGAFSDGFTPSRRHGHVQAFWPGDATHAPAQSSRCAF